MADEQAASPLEDRPQETPEGKAETPEDAATPEGGEPETAAANEGEQESAEQKRKRLGGWQRKIVRLEQERDLWREEALKGRTPQAASAPQAPKPPARPTPEQFADSAGVIDWGKYGEAETKWLQDQIEFGIQSREAARTAEAATAAYRNEEKEILSDPEWEDYREVVANRPRYSEAMVVQIVKSGELGPYMDYYLSLHPEEAQEIFSIRDKDDQVAAMGEVRAKIRSLLAEADSGEEVEETEPPKPKAAKPIKPVTKPAPSTAAPTENDDADTWAKKRWAQVRAQGRSW